jgi:adenosylhomocysteine nucleosidase
LGNVGRSGLLPDRLGIVTGLDFEARLARRLSDRVACSAGVAASAARRLIDEGAEALMSFGIAGGLIPELRPGALIVADKIVTAGGTYPAISHIAAHVRAQVGPLYGDINISSHPTDKKSFHDRTGALAVDLESGEVARVAAEANLPFMAIRAIADPAWRGLPEAALLPLDEKGRPQLGAVFASIARRPTQIPGLILVALDTRAAMRSLLRACRVLV